MVEQNLAELIKKIASERESKQGKPRLARIKEHQIGRVLKKIGMFHLSDRSANLVIAYLARLHFEFKSRLEAKVAEHLVAYQHLDYFLTKHALIYRDIPNEKDIEIINRELVGNLDKSPLAAMLVTRNNNRSFTDQNWRLLQYYSAVASISLLVSHIKFVSVKNENILMPAIAAGLRRVRLSQSKAEYSLMLPDIVLDGSLQDFVENWKLFNLKVNEREGEAKDKNLSETIAYQRSGPLQNLVHKFWDNVSSQPSYDRANANNRRSRMRFSLTKIRPVRVRSSVSRRKSDKRDGEEVAVEQKSDFDILESEASHSHQYSSNNYARHKQAGAILARNIRAELAIPAIPQLLSQGQVKFLLEALELHSERARNYQVDAWIFLIVYLSQTLEVLTKSYFEKKYKQDDLCISLSRHTMRYKIERNLSSHVNVERMGLLEARDNEFEILLPKSFRSDIVFPRSADDFPTEKEIQARLQDICAAKQISRVSINQLAAWQFLYLSRTWPERSEAAALAGFQQSDWTPLYYCALNTSKLQHRHAELWANITYETEQWTLANDFENLYSTADKSTTGRYGSTLRLKLDKLELFFKHLRTYIEQLKQSINSYSQDNLEQLGELKKQRKQLHNAYTVYVLLIIKMLTGIRPIRSYFSSIADFDLVNNRVYINDKQRREGMARIVPICGTLKAQLTEYFNYLGAIVVDPDSQPPTLVEQAKLICKSEAEPFQIYNLGRLEAVTPQALEIYLCNLFPVPLNFARHVLRTWLYDNSTLNSVVVDDFMSHDIEAQMSQGLYSAYCCRDEMKLCRELENFAQAMNLTVINNPVVLPYIIEKSQFMGLPTFVDQRNVTQFEKTTDRARRLKKVIQRERRIEQKIRAYISESCPELARGEGTDEELSVYVNKVSEFINSKYQHSEYYVAMKYLMKTCDLINSNYERSIVLPRVPVKITREPATRDALSVNLAQRAAILRKLINNVQFELGKLTDVDIRCLLVLLTAVQSSQNTKTWLQLLFSQSYQNIKLHASRFCNEQLVWLPLVINETSVVNDLHHKSGPAHLEYLFLSGLQTGLVLELLERKSKAINHKLSDIPALLKASKNLKTLASPFFTRDGKTVAVAALLKFAVDAVAHDCRDYSFALRHTANAMIETYSLAAASFEYLLQPVLNQVIVPPNIANIVFDSRGNKDTKENSRVKRKHVKQAIGMEALDLYYALNKLFKANGKLSSNQIVSELEKLIALFKSVDAVVYLLNWFIYHLKFRNNSLSSVRRYHSAITLNWFMVTVVIDDLSELSGAEFHDLYRQAIELTQGETNEDIEKSVGADELPSSAKLEKGLTLEQRAKEKKRHSERHEEQIQRDKNTRSYNYLCETFERLHHYFVSQYQLAPLDEPLKASISRRKEHVRAGYVSYELYQAILANLPLTLGCDDDTKFALQVITILAYRTGMRINEILTLTIKDVTTINERWIRVRNNAFGKLKSISSCRDIAVFALLTDEELSLFNQWVQRRVARSKKRNELLFCDSDSPRKVWPYWLIKQSIVAWMRALGGQNMSFVHDFRHTVLSNLQLLVENEKDLFCALSGHNEESAQRIIENTLGGSHVSIDRYYALAMIAGHASPSVTFKSYLHFSALLRHLKISATNWHYTRDEVKKFTHLTDKQIAHLCLPAKPAENKKRKRPRRNSDHVDANNLLEYLVKSNKKFIHTVKRQPAKIIEFASDTLLLKASASDVHDILQAVVDGKSNHEISQLYQIDEELIQRYREQARKLLEVHTQIKNRRLISKQDEAKNVYMPLKPYTAKERDIARRMINSMVNTSSLERRQVLLELADYYIRNIHPDESGVRFRELEKLNWFVDAMHPYVSLKNWFMFVVTRKFEKNSALQFLEKVSITTKRPIVKFKKQGKPEFYLRLKNPEPDKRKQNANFQSTSLLKYVFAMTTIMIRAEEVPEIKVDCVGDSSDINQSNADSQSEKNAKDGQESDNTEVLELTKSC